MFQFMRQWKWEAGYEKNAFIEGIFLCVKINKSMKI